MCGLGVGIPSRRSASSATVRWHIYKRPFLGLLFYLLKILMERDGNIEESVGIFFFFFESSKGFFFNKYKMRHLNKSLIVSEFLCDGWCVRGDSGPQVGALFSHRSRDGAALHFPFIIDDDAGIVFEVQGDTVLSVIRFPLTNYHRGNHLLQICV